METKFQDIDEYLDTLPGAERACLDRVRAAIRAAAPEAVECISYGMPTFKLRGRPLIYFAAAKHHCALYGTGEGTIRFPAAEPPSEERIRALVNSRMAAIGEGKPVRRRKVPPQSEGHTT